MLLCSADTWPVLFGNQVRSDAVLAPHLSLDLSWFSSIDWKVRTFADVPDCARGFADEEATQKPIA
jgi:hypothetical protein